MTTQLGRVPDFTLSRQKEVDGLLKKGVFEIVKQAPQGVRLFNSRFVDDIKDKDTPTAYEKSRLVVQAYNDYGKLDILTESPTIQRSSQRLILCLAAILPNTKLYVRDISQAYVQSTTLLNRSFYMKPPANSALYGKGLLKVLRPLYGIPEAGTHWYKTYHKHHTEKLGLKASTYDPCLLHTTSNSNFGLVGLQTDDTLILGTETFIQLEKQQLNKAKLLAKPLQQLAIDTSLRFNGGVISLQTTSSITLTQERQCIRIQLVPIDLNKATDTYVAQRARGAYVATFCQPEASFDLSCAAQSKTPDINDIKQLNKRLKWQIDNPSRGLTFISLTNDLKLMIFVDASFANNKDLSSQLGYLIILANEQQGRDSFDINANIIHWQSVKCKRVTRSVLASELYAMTLGFDAAAAIKGTIEAILQQPVPLILYTDSRSLYDCVVKLGTTSEKRLMIDIMCLRQSYERREVTEVRWIEGASNPADGLTKSTSCSALKSLIDTNRLNVKTRGWVEREET
jgi:hypothetical protein